MGSICPVKFQGCFGMATLGFLPFSPIKKQFRTFLSLFHYCMLGVWGAENLSFQFTGLLGKEELHSRSCTQGTAHRSLIFTCTTFIWQDLHDLTWCYKGLIVEGLSGSKEYFSCESDTIVVARGWTYFPKMPHLSHVLFLQRNTDTPSDLCNYLNKEYVAQWYCMDFEAKSKKVIGSYLALFLSWTHDLGADI